MNKHIPWGDLKMIEFRKRLFVFYIIALSTMYAIKHIGARHNSESKKSTSSTSLARQDNH